MCILAIFCCFCTQKILTLPEGFLKNMNFVDTFTFLNIFFSKLAGEKENEAKNSLVSHLKALFYSFLKPGWV